VIKVYEGFACDISTVLAVSVSDSSDWQSTVLMNQPDGTGYSRVIMTCSRESARALLSAIESK